MTQGLRTATSLYPRFYDSPAWRTRRAHQLSQFPFCAFCQRHGVSRLATVADHITPHRGNAELFWHGPLQSLCAHCHSAHKQSEEVMGYSGEIGSDGWPIDARHPVYRGRVIT